MPSFSNLSICLEWIKFLGSSDRIIVGGNDINNNARLQILYKDSDPIDNNISNSFSISSDIKIDNETLATCELCGLPRLGKTFTAISSISNSTKLSSISLVDIEADLNNSSLKLIKFNNTKSVIPYTSVLFHPELELLTSTDESGICYIFDIQTQSLIHSFKVDSCGIDDSKFLPSGHLVTLSNSYQTPIIKFWDLRTIRSDSSSAYTTKPSHILKSNESIKNTGKYNCIESHPLQDKLICGSKNGYLSVWDVRLSDIYHCKPHNSQINDISFHPLNHDIYITSSSDGTVKQTNFYNNLPTNQDISDILISSPMKHTNICCVDSIESRDSAHTGVAIAGSKTGGLWTINV